MGIPVNLKNATVTITNASPAVITWTAHGLTAGTKVVFATTVQLPPPLIAGKSYTILTVVSANTFTVSDDTGVVVATTGAGSGTHTGIQAAADQAAIVILGNFVTTGNSTGQTVYGPFNMFLWGTFSGTVLLQRSFDSGGTWITCSTDSSGTLASYAAAVSLVINEPEAGMQYRLNCSAYTSGTINYRISGGQKQST